MARPADFPLWGRYLTLIQHFRLIILIKWKSKTQPGWVILTVKCLDAPRSLCMFVPSDESLVNTFCEMWLSAMEQKKWIGSGGLVRPTELWSSRVCLLSDDQISPNYFTYRSLLIFRSCTEDQMLQDLILCTRLCGTGFITQHGWVVHLILTNMVIRK